MIDIYIYSEVQHGTTGVTQGVSKCGPSKSPNSSVHSSACHPETTGALALAQAVVPKRSTVSPVLCDFLGGLEQLRLKLPTIAISAQFHRTSSHYYSICIPYEL